jgi:hypothetical protein
MRGKAEQIISKKQIRISDYDTDLKWVTLYKYMVPDINTFEA